MNEEQIAQDLARRTEEPVVPVVPAPEPTSPEPQNFVDKLLPEEQLTAAKLMDYLEIPMVSRHEPIVDNYVRTVYDWAREIAGSGDFLQLIRVISEQEQHMGSRLKPNRLARLAEYVKINRLRQEIFAKERELYYG